MRYSNWRWDRKAWLWDWRFGGDNSASIWDLISLSLVLIRLSVLIGVVGHVWSWMMVVRLLVLGVVGGIVRGCIVLGPVVL